MVTAAHLEKFVPLYLPGGIIKGWNLHWSQTGNIKLEDNNSTLTVTSSGLFMIYAQLCYSRTESSSGFEIKLSNSGSAHSPSKTIAQCTAPTTNPGKKVTCYTSVLQVMILNMH